MAYLIDDHFLFIFHILLSQLLSNYPLFIRSFAGEKLPGGSDNYRIRGVDKLLYFPGRLRGPAECSGVVPVPLCALATDQHGDAWPRVPAEALASAEEGGWIID